MALYLRLAGAFFKIGLLTVGGGLAMIPVVQHEMARLGWLDSRQFLDILGIAEMTPGPMAVNTATFVGYRVAGAAHPGSFGLALAGALVCTVAVCAPSVLCVNLLGGFWARNREHPGMVRVFAILRPLVCGLVITAAVFLTVSCLWGEAARGRDLLARPDAGAALIVAGAFALTAFTRVSPILILAGGAAAGVALGALV